MVHNESVNCSTSNVHVWWKMLRFPWIIRIKSQEIWSVDRFKFTYFTFGLTWFHSVVSCSEHALCFKYWQSCFKWNAIVNFPCSLTLHDTFNVIDLNWNSVCWLFRTGSVEDNWWKKKKQNWMDFIVHAYHNYRSTIR